MKNLSKSLLALALILLTTNFLFAQKSPKMSAEGKAGSTDISVKWGAPSVKGREIWGKLVPYGQVWRTGANDATTIKFSKAVKINGKELAAGEYALFTIPTEGKWTIIFNKTAKQWGAYEYKEADDALRVEASTATNAMTEQMTIKVEAAGAKAQVVILWEKLKVAFEVSE
jgi:carbonic anhydrase